MNLEKPEYEKDFYAWALHTAKLIRDGNFSAIDREYVAEEIEDMGKSDRRELVNRLSVLLAHLLKWKYQPIRRGNSWKCTIKLQRLEIRKNLEESPSLQYELNRQVDDAYEKALIIASAQTGLSENTFPKKCPFILQECLDDDFFPE